MTALPAICDELRLRAVGVVAWVINSRDVAETFEKRHDDVLKAIRNLECSDRFRLRNFAESSYTNLQNREMPSVDMTRQGFTRLAMGFTGEKAAAFIERYIEAFDAMEAALREPRSEPVSTDQLLSSVREIVAPLAVRFDSQDVAIERVEHRVDAIAEDVGSIKLRLFNSRKRISPTVRAEHANAIELLGGRCPCCGTAEVIVERQVSRFADYDHFYQNSRADADHSWLICRPCHNELTTGRVARDQREAQFRAYQDKRRRLPGRQAKLF